MLSGNALKLIALITMTFDHVGCYIFPHTMWLRIVGRLAFPIYGYMIAEGCRYTKNRTRYLFSILSVGIICQIAYLVVCQSVYQCIMITFSMSIAVIYTIDLAAKKKITPLAPILAVLTALFLTEILPNLISFCDYDIDYGFCGVMYPVLIYIASGKRTRLFAALLGLCLVSMTLSSVQWYSLSALIPLMLYSGERGTLRLKSFFYLYYPLHLAAIYVIARFLSV